MRKRIYSIVTRGAGDDHVSKTYDIFIMIVALLSITPMMSKTLTPLLSTIDLITVYILFADYIFRWVTYDYVSKREGILPFVLYPVTPFALMDLVSLLPSLGLLGDAFRIVRLFRIFKVLRYSRTFSYIEAVFRKEKETLGYVLIIALSYIFLSALVMFTFEPDTFANFFDALYWATTALTTVGYGDVYPVTTVGKLVSMVSSLFGIAIIALPAGIVTAGFVEAIDEDKKQKKKEAHDQKKAEKAARKTGEDDHEADE
jgi:voltage-gated potassium channel